MRQIDLHPLPPEEAVRFFRGNGFEVSINQHVLLSSPDMRDLTAVARFTDFWGFLAITTSQIVSATRAR